MQATFGFKNLNDFFKELERQGELLQRNAHIASKKEAFRLMKVLQHEIKEGAPGGRKFAPLSVIGSYAHRPYKRHPLKRLARGVKYSAVKHPDGSGSYKVGFIAGRSASKLISIADYSQAGTTIPYSTRAREYLARWGAGLSQQGQRGLSKNARITGDGRFFFLRKSTRKGKVPARPIIDPFWRAHKEEARRNITANFHRLMRGERIP